MCFNEYNAIRDMNKKSKKKWVEKKKQKNY